MKVLEGLKYTPEHEWVKVEGDYALIGITDHAQETLGSVVFIDLPRVGQSFNQGDSFGAVESVKAASDLYLPVSGEITEVNEALEDAPELLNEDCYQHWIVKIKISNADELSSLLDDKGYQALDF
ncbi:MAG: glycine cleavage system protein GcvH [Acholeplasmataceae bacterium]